MNHTPEHHAFAELLLSELHAYVFSPENDIWANILRFSFDDLYIRMNRIDDLTISKILNAVQANQQNGSHSAASILFYNKVTNFINDFQHAEITELV